MDSVVLWICSTLFWLCVVMLVYVYLGYPAMCALLARILRRWPRISEEITDAKLPRVTVLIAAFNEAQHIAETIENKLALDYPRELIEVIVISDGSYDGTDQIVNRYIDRGVRLIRQEPRAGKTAALNLAQPYVTGNVIAFSDANSVWAPDALRQLVALLFDPTVGYVTGRMVYLARNGTLTGEGCSAYMRYENQLRWWETGVGSIVGVDGGIDAVRKELYEPLRPDQLPDFVLPLSVRERGWRVVYAPRALLYEDALSVVGEEWQMRVRVSLRAWHALRDKVALFGPLRFGLFAWQLASHKLLRYLAPVFQLGAFCANILLSSKGIFWLTVLVMQVGFYGMATIGLFNSDELRKGGGWRRIIGFPHYLCLVNAASLVALIQFFRGQKQVIWKPRT